jgi:hypothetical protein
MAITDKFAKTTYGYAPCSVLRPDPGRNEEDTVYVEAESVVVGPLSNGHHGCAGHGGKQQKNGKWKCSKYSQHRR